MVYQSRIPHFCHPETLVHGADFTVRYYKWQEKEPCHRNTKGIKSENKKQVKTRTNSSDENTREKTQQHLLALELGAGKGIIKGNNTHKFIMWPVQIFSLTKITRDLLSPYAHRCATEANLSTSAFPLHPSGNQEQAAKETFAWDLSRK